MPLAEIIAVVAVLGLIIGTGWAIYRSGEKKEKLTRENKEAKADIHEKNEFIRMLNEIGTDQAVLEAEARRVFARGGTLGDFVRLLDEARKNPKAKRTGTAS